VLGEGVETPDQAESVFRLTANESIPDVAGIFEDLVVLRLHLGGKLRCVTGEFFQEESLVAIVPGEKALSFGQDRAVFAAGTHRRNKLVEAGFDGAVLAEQQLSQWSRSVTSSVTASSARW